MIQRLLLSIFPLLLLCKTLCGQNYFQKTYDLSLMDGGHGLEVLPNGDLLTSGVYTTIDPFFAQFMLIQRLDPLGNVLWSKIFNGNGQAVATDIQRATIGDGLWVAFNSSVGLLGQTQGGWMKISENGDVLFSRKDASVSGYKKILPLSDGGCLITGYEEPSSFFDAFALKINTNGNEVWKTGFGGAGDDGIENCWEDAEGFIYCSGYSVNFNGNRDGMLAKLSPTGAVLWTRRYGTGASDQFSGLAAFGSDSSLLLAGYTNGFGGELQVLLTKANAFGELKWSRTYSIPGQNLGAIDLQQVPGNQFLVSASDPANQIGSPAILFKISEDGNLLWEYAYKTGGERLILQEVLPAPGGFVAVGSSTFNGDENVYVLKVAGDGLIPGSDCCPAPAGLTVRDVTLNTEPFTAGADDAYDSGSYQVTVTDALPQANNICSPIDLAFAVSDSSICPGECVDIVVSGNTPGVNYSFSSNGGVFDSDNPMRICFSNEGTYFLTRKGENNVCSKDLSIKIEVGNKTDAFPNAFTPNGDGVNDTFKPVFFCPVVTTHFIVYNRWGQKVFETRDPNAAWDGEVDGAEASSDVYAWQVEYEVARAGANQKLMEKGDVALLR